MDMGVRSVPPSSGMARADYMKRWRDANPEGRAREVAAAAARREAMTELSRMYPGTYHELLNVARARRGLPPLRRR